MISKNFDHLPVLKFENTHIKFVESHKHLGLTLSYDGKWTDHIHNVKTSAAKVLGIMQKLFIQLERFKSNIFFVSIASLGVCLYCLGWLCSP